MTTSRSKVSEPAWSSQPVGPWLFPGRKNILVRFGPCCSEMCSPVLYNPKESSLQAPTQRVNSNLILGWRASMDAVFRLFCSPKDPCSSCIFVLFGGWGVLGNCSQSFGLWNFLSARVQWEVAVCSPGSQRLSSLLCVVCGEHQGICSTALRGEVPCHAALGALAVAFLMQKIGWSLLRLLLHPWDQAQGTGLGPPHLGSTTQADTLHYSLKLHSHTFFFHVQCQGWMWRGRSRLRGKLNLAFPQLQVTSSLLRRVLLWRLVCIYRRSHRGWMYLQKYACSNSSFTIGCWFNFPLAQISEQFV